jgi:RNA polymerase-binding transcription factor DksA
MPAKKKPAPKAPAKSVKKVAAKAAAKAAPAKKPAAKAPAKPVKKAPAKPVKKAPAKPVKKAPAPQKTSPVKKSPSKPAAKKPAAKPVAKKPVAKPAPKKPLAPAKKAPVAKKPAPKPALANKPVAKPAPAKSAPAKKPVAKAAPAPKAVPAKKAPAAAVKPAQTVATPAKKEPVKASAPAKPVKTAAKPKGGTRIINVKRDIHPLDEGITIEKPKKPVLPAAFLKKQRQRLVELRDAYMNAAEGVASESLRSHEGGDASAFGMHQADAGSDAYDRDFALSLLAKEQDAIYEINEALNRIDKGTYGICEMSGATIPEERLEALPFTRFTVACQARLEREQRGGRWTRPVRSLFGLDESAEDAEDGDDDDSTTTTSSGGGSNESLDFGKE